MRTANTGKYKNTWVLFLLFTLSNIFSQNAIRFPLWTMLEAEPSTQYKAVDNEELMSYAVTEMKQLAPFIIEGIIYGWKFSYTPSDKFRNIGEFFSFEPLFTLSANDPNLLYTDIAVADNKLSCWVEYVQSNEILQKRAVWNTVQYKKIKGRGVASFVKGVLGMKEACSNSVKNAVHEYTRTIRKNKPKEINGVVILQDYPNLGSTAGKFSIEADYYIRIDEIIPYTQF